ncbi:MAG: toxin-antitoxin system [Terriglobia bacterium]
MAQLVVRHLDTGIKLRLQRRAKRHGRRMEEGVRDIPRDAAKEEATPGGGLGTEIASLFKQGGLEADIPELHGQGNKPASFD